MSSIRNPFRRNAAILAASAIIGALGIGGVVAANADGGSPAPTGQVQQSDGETDDDATDTGPDADPNEPGHQDASDTDGTEAGDGDGEVADDGVAAQSDGETDDDATDTGPDANPDEPGHQDASDYQG